MDEMKILLVIDNLGSGGAQNQLTILAQELKKKGYEIEVFTYFPSSFFKDRLSSLDIPVIFRQKKGKVGFNTILSLTKIIFKGDYNVIISFLDTPNFYSAVSKKLVGLLRKTKLIVSYRSKTNFKNLSLFDLLLRKFVNNCADFIVANSNHERQNWQINDKRNSYKWKTIYNAVDRDIFYRNHNVKKNNYLLSVGSVSSSKNGLQLIKAISILKKQGIEIEVLWIGEIQKHIKERKIYFEQMVNLIDVLDIGKLWNWKNPHSNINNEYNLARLLVLSSKTEGLPNVVCEAQSCGLPCIVSNVLDHDQLIIDGVSGYLFDPDSPDDLAEKIKMAYFKSEEEYVIMEEKSIENSIDLFLIDNYVDSFIRLISI